MIFVTSEYLFVNPIKTEINNVIDNTILDHKKMVIIVVEKPNLDVKFNFLIKEKTKQKNSTVNRGINRTKIASQGRYELIKMNK